MKKLAALNETEECDVETDSLKRFPKKVKDCKLFIGVSILILCISIILTVIMIYFYLKSKNNNVFPY